MEFGKTLRNAREAKGYTISQLADITRLASTTITELENEDFSRIAAPIYGRGFVKLYCEAVDLDSRTLVAEFMEIINGNRDTGIKERIVQPTTVEEPIPVINEEPPINEIKLDSQEQDLFSASNNVAVEPQVQSKPSVELPHHDTKKVFSKFAALSEKKPQFPISIWRLCTIAVIFGLFIAAIITGIRAVYKATAPINNTKATEKEVITHSVKPPTNEVKPKVTTKRETQKIPSLYID